MTGKIIAGILVTGLGPCFLSYHFRQQPDVASLVHLKPITRTSALEVLVSTNSQWPSPDMTSAAESLTQIEQAFAEAGGDFQKLDQVFTILLPKLVGNDPWAAAHLADRLENGELREETLRQIALNWAAKDPAGAEKWAGAMANTIERDVAVSAMSLAIASSDPTGAIQLRERFSLDTYTSSALENVVQSWAEKEPATALDWATALPASDKRDALISRIAFVLSSSQPAAAAWLVAEEIAPGETQNEAVLSVLHQWTRKDPEAALAWINRFPDVPLREIALEELAKIETRQCEIERSTPIVEVHGVPEND